MSKARGPYRVDPLGHKKSQQALDKKAENARELGLDYEPAQQGLSDLDVWKARALQAEAVIAKFMAEQPAQQEPVAWAMYQRGVLSSFWMDKGDAYDFEFTSEHRWEPLYTSPPAQQEPVGSLSVRYHRNCKSMTNTDFDYNGDLPEGDYELYPSPPPQRPWVGLTNEEFESIEKATLNVHGIPKYFGTAIEAKLKEKNT